MNVEIYVKVFIDQVFVEVCGEVFDNDWYNKFYDEYLVVMDMIVEFYLLMVECIFKNNEIKNNIFIVNGMFVDIIVICDVVLMMVEGVNDDILVFG